MLQKAFLYWQASKSQPGEVMSFAWTWARERLPVYPSRLGLVHPDSVGYPREESPQANEVELVYLVEKENSRGRFYVAFPADNQRFELPGWKEPLPVTFSRNDLLLTHILAPHRYVRIFKSDAKSVPEKYRNDDYIDWLSLPKELLVPGREIRCWINYFTNPQNRVVGKAYPSVKWNVSRGSSVIEIPLWRQVIGMGSGLKVELGECVARYEADRHQLWLFYPSADEPVRGHPSPQHIRAMRSTIEYHAKITRITDCIPILELGEPV